MLEILINAKKVQFYYDFKHLPVNRVEFAKSRELFFNIHYGTFLKVTEKFNCLSEI